MAEASAKPAREQPKGLTNLKPQTADAAGAPNQVEGGDDGEIAAALSKTLLIADEDNGRLWNQNKVVKGDCKESGECSMAQLTPLAREAFAIEMAGRHRMPHIYIYIYLYVSARCSAA